MAVPIDKLFLIIGLIALPNLYYRGQYNVPLMLFSFGVWNIVHYRPLVVYLILISWLVDGYCIIKSLIEMGYTSNSQKPMIILVLQSVVFVCKIVVLIMTFVLDRQARKAIYPPFMCKYLQSTLQDKLVKQEQN